MRSTVRAIAVGLRVAIYSLGIFSPGIANSTKIVLSVAASGDSFRGSV